MRRLGLISAEEFHRASDLPAVLYSTGLRRAEAVALDLADDDSETGALTIRSRFRLSPP
jgi:site-specific recombinase XerD